MKFDLKERSKAYSFWFAILSALFLLIQAIGEPLGLVISEETYMSVINSLLGIFVVLGIISDPTKKKKNQEDSATKKEEERDLEGK